MYYFHVTESLELNVAKLTISRITKPASRSSCVNSLCTNYGRQCEQHACLVDALRLKCMLQHRIALGAICGDVAVDHGDDGDGKTCTT